MRFLCRAKIQGTFDCDFSIMPNHLNMPKLWVFYWLSYFDFNEINSANRDTGNLFPFLRSFSFCLNIHISTDIEL